VQKFGVTAQQVTLFLGDVRPGSELAFDYTLRPKCSIKATAAEISAHRPAARGGWTRKGRGVD
jgi:hypothetical protein